MTPALVALVSLAAGWWLRGTVGHWWRFRRADVETARRCREAWEERKRRPQPIKPNPAQYQKGLNIPAPTRPDPGLPERKDTPPPPPPNDPLRRLA